MMSGKVHSTQCERLPSLCKAITWLQVCWRIVREPSAIIILRERQFEFRWPAQPRGGDRREDKGALRQHAIYRHGSSGWPRKVA